MHGHAPPQQRHVARRPDNRRQYQQRKAKVGRQPEMRHIGAPDQPGNNHPPADRALQTAQRQNKQQPPPIACRNHPPHAKKSNGRPKTTPIARASRRWKNSQKNIALNAARSIERLTV